MTSTTPSSTTPPSYVAFRAVTAAATALIVAAVGFGLAGMGPLAGLGGLFNQAVYWFEIATGVMIP